MCKVLKKFSKVIGVAIFGIVVGILLGFVFGSLIAFLSSVWPGPDLDGENVPLAIGSFFGMGVGAVVGGIFGGVVAYKE